MFKISRCPFYKPHRHKGIILFERYRQLVHTCNVMKTRICIDRTYEINVPRLKSHGIITNGGSPYTIEVPREAPPLKKRKEFIIRKYVKRSLNNSLVRQNIHVTFLVFMTLLKPWDRLYSHFNVNFYSAVPSSTYSAVPSSTYCIYCY